MEVEVALEPAEVQEAALEVVVVRVQAWELVSKVASVLVVVAVLVEVVDWARALVLEAASELAVAAVLV